MLCRWTRARERRDGFRSSGPLAALFGRQLFGNVRLAPTAAVHSITAHYASLKVTMDGVELRQHRAYLLRSCYRFGFDSKKTAADRTVL
jgi:hypothetical protein